METKFNAKEQLLDTIKEWVRLDNEINLLKNEVKERNNRKKGLSENLVKVMKQHSIEVFDISGGALVYKKSKVKKAICGKSLLEALQTYFKDKPEFAADVAKYVLDNREVVEKDVIKMRVDK